MCKESWFVRLGQEGVAWMWKGLSEIPFKGWGGSEKMGGETKILKEGQAELRGGCLKRGEGWNPLANYVLFSDNLPWF